MWENQYTALLIITINRHRLLLHSTSSRVKGRHSTHSQATHSLHQPRGSSALPRRAHEEAPPTPFRTVVSLLSVPCGRRLVPGHRVRQLFRWLERSGKLSFLLQWADSRIRVVVGVFPVVAVAAAGRGEREKKKNGAAE